MRFGRGGCLLEALGPLLELRPCTRLCVVVARPEVALEVVLVGVVAVEDEDVDTDVVGLGVVVGASSVSGFTTTSELTGVTKLYAIERLVAFSVSRRCMPTSLLLVRARRSSLMVK